MKTLVYSSIQTTTTEREINSKKLLDIIEIDASKCDICFINEIYVS